MQMYNGIMILITLLVIDNSLAPKWQPTLSTRNKSYVKD